MQEGLIDRLRWWLLGWWWWLLAIGFLSTRLSQVAACADSKLFYLSPD